MNRNDINENTSNPNQRKCLTCNVPHLDKQIAKCYIVTFDANQSLAMPFTPYAIITYS